MTSCSLTAHVVHPLPRRATPATNHPTRATTPPPTIQDPQCGLLAPAPRLHAHARPPATCTHTRHRSRHHSHAPPPSRHHSRHRTRLPCNEKYRRRLPTGSRTCANERRLSTAARAPQAPTGTRRASVRSAEVIAVLAQKVALQTTKTTINRFCKGVYAPRQGESQPHVGE